jgi:pimeloyl-ACP methyl ester carboxylesterase
MWWLVVLFLADSVKSPQTFMVPLSATESLSVETAGRGEPLVLIPGLFGSAFGFRTVVPLLNAAGYRTIVVEPLGIGASARPEKATYSLTAQADRIAAVLDTLHVRAALVLGHSLGGAEALRLAYRRPDLVKGLVTIEGGPTETTMTPSFKRALRFAPWIKLFGGVRLVRRKVRSLLLASSGDSQWVTEDVISGYTAGAARNLDATLKAYIRCPVRLLVGTARHDGSVPDREVSLFKQALRSFARDSVSGAGHFIQEEQPAAVVSAVDRLRASVTPVARP